MTASGGDRAGDCVGMSVAVDTVTVLTVLTTLYKSLQCIDDGVSDCC